MRRSVAAVACALTLLASTAAGAEATFVDLGDYPMPLYDGDLEDRDGVPQPAFELAELMKMNRSTTAAKSEGMRIAVNIQDGGWTVCPSVLPKNGFPECQKRSPEG